MPIPQSQALHGPYLISYGDVQDYLIRAKRRINVTPNEYEMLVALVHSLPRPGYKTHLLGVIRKEAKEWQESTLMRRQHIHTAFEGLAKKGLIRIIKSPGLSNFYVLTPDFITCIVNEAFDLKVVENSFDCNEFCDTTVTNLVTDCNESRDSPSYIESPYSLNSPTFTSSTPAVDNVDNFGLDEIDEVRALATYLDAPKLDQAKSFYSKLRGENLKLFPDFIRHLQSSGKRGLGTQEINREWIFMVMARDTAQVTC